MSRLGLNERTLKGFIMSRPFTYKPEYCERAAEVLGNGESLAAVCAELEITRSTLYEWRDTFPEFRNAIEIGLAKAQRDWEKIGRDGITGEYEKFSASPWIFTMKNRFRTDYQEDKKEQSVSDSIVEKLIDKLVE